MNDTPVNRQTLLDEKRNVTSRVTEIVRYIGFGLVAVFYAINTAGNDFSEGVRGTSPFLLYSVGVFGALTIILDYLQFLFASKSVQEALDSKDQRYNYRSVWYRGRVYFWEAKQWAVLFGCGCLLILLVGAF